MVYRRNKTASSNEARKKPAPSRTEGSLHVLCLRSGRAPTIFVAEGNDEQSKDAFNASTKQHGKLVNSDYEWWRVDRGCSSDVRSQEPRYAGVADAGLRDGRASQCYGFND